MQSKGQALRTVRLVFHGGLLLAASALVLVVTGVFVERIGPLIRLETAIAYVAAAVLHMVGLVAAVRFTVDSHRQHGIGFLYTAGFVHTLIALGVAIGVGGAELLTTGAMDARAIGIVLFPMGAAVLPHAVGVWLGQDIEASLPSPSERVQEGVLGGLKRDAGQARAELQALYDARRATLEREVEALTRQLDLWTDMESKVTAWVRSAEGRLHTVAEAAGAAERLLQGVEQAASESTASLRGFKAAIQDGTSQLNGIEPGVKELAERIEQVGQMSGAIVDLLEHRLFERPS